MQRQKLKSYLWHMAAKGDIERGKAILLVAVKSGDVSDEAVESVLREFKHALPEVLVEPPFLRGEEYDG